MELEAGKTVLLRTEGADGPDVVSALVRHVIWGTKEINVISVEIGVKKAFKKKALLDLHAESGGAAWFVPCQVAHVKRSGSGDVLDLRFLEEPQKVDHRSAERVETYAHGVTASIEDRPQCLVVDVSERGLAIVTTQRYDVGQVVRLKLEWKGREWEGIVTITRIAQADKREASLYGLRVRSGAEGGRLEDGLESVTATIRLHQLLVV